jgi:ABC-type sugar transport system substrate-binding protein
MRTAAKVAALALALPILAACSGGGSGSSSEPTEEDSDGITIGFPLPGPAPYIDGYLEKWNELAAAEGVTIVETVGDWTPALQAEQIDSLIAQKPDAIVIWAVDNKAILPVLARIKEAGIPAIASNAYPEEAAFDYLEGYTGPDDVLQGKIAGQNLVEAIGASGEVAMVRGTPGTAAHDNRATGFEQALTEAPNVVLVADQSGAWGDSKKAYDIVSAMLKRNPDIKGIFIQDDGMAEGAAQAIQDAGATVALVGVGGSCAAHDQIRAGNLDATTVQDPWADAEVAFRAVVAAAKGETIKRVTFLDPPVLTIDNVDSFDCHF